MSAHAVNLLPEETIRGYRRQRRILIIARIVWAAGFLVAIVTVFIAAAWQYLVIVRDTEKDRLAAVEQTQASELERSRRAGAALAALTQEVRVLRDLEKPQYDPSLLAREVVRVLPAGAKLQTFTIAFEPTDAKPAKGADAAKERQRLFLAGKAATRGDVLNFEHALKGLPFVGAVEGPLENILKPSDASFSFEVSLKELAEDADASVGASSIRGESQ